MRRVVIAAAAAVCVGFGPATASRADMWVGPLGEVDYQPGQWFVGPGVTGGIYTRPDWRAPFAMLPDPSDGAPFQNSFDQNLGVVGPGLTLGHVLHRDALPAWVGERPRVLFSFGYSQGRRTDSTSAGIFDDPSALIFTQSGLVGINTAVGGGDTTVEERLKSTLHAFELALRLDADRPVASNLVLTTSVGIFGGLGREKFEYSAAVRDDGNPEGFYDLEQRLNSHRIGADLGLALSWLFLGGDLRLSLGGRAGLYWMKSSVRGNDCFVNALGSPCATPADTFIPNAAFNTTGSDSDSTVGFRGTVTGAIAYRLSFATVRIGGFFTWESAVAGVRNPAADLASPPPVNTFVGGPRVDFDSGYNTGGFLVVSIPLN